MCSNFATSRNIVIAIVDDLWLDDRDEAGTLATCSIFCETGAILVNGTVGWSEKVAISDVNGEGGAPFGEAKAHVVIFGKTSR